MRTMNLLAHTTLSSLYTGTWYFAYIMDYCLKIKVRERYLDISLTNVTRDEECELTPISINAAYLAFRMDSSWGALRLHLYPHAESGGILVEIWDTDRFFRSDEVCPEPPHRHVAHITCTDEDYPAWIEGVWKTALWEDSRRLYLNRISPRELRLASWYMEEDGTPSYDHVAEVYTCGYTGLKMSLRRRDFLYSPVQETNILFDSGRQELSVEFNRICRPARALPKPNQFPDAWRD